MVTVIAKKQHKSKVSNFFILLLFGLCCKDIKKGVPLDKPLVINGVTYYYKTIITCEKNINYTTLQEIQKNKYPDVTGRVMFMIESFFIMTDAQSYKLDADYIARTELLNSKDFDAFKDYPPFSIIRVLTKRDRTVRVR